MRDNEKKVLRGCREILSARFGKHRAFTLVEILVVILIIGLLFVFLVPKIDNASDKSRETGIKTDFRSYQLAFEAVSTECGGLGTNAIEKGTDNEPLILKINQYLDKALEVKTDIVEVGESKHRETAKRDPWNNYYRVKVYQSEGSENDNNGKVLIYTLGKNSKGDIPVPSGSGIALTGDAVDNYALLTVSKDGVTTTRTFGFTTNQN